MSVFAQKDYKSALLLLIETKRQLSHEPKLWTLTAIADACGIQKTYLSRVLNDEAHLSEDQLYLALEYLNASEGECGFVALLHRRDRSQIGERRKKIETEISDFRRDMIDTKDHLRSETSSISTSEMNLYYLDPIIQLIHLFLTIPRYAENPQQLTTKLGISSEFLSQSMESLRGLGVITIRDRKIVVLKDSLHLSSDSHVIRPYQILSRLKGLEKLQKSRGKEQFAYSLYFSADDEARAQILTAFMAFLRQTEKIVRPAACDKVFQINFDLYDWEL